MEDREIIELYHRRDESAIAETARKYGARCQRIAMNLLGVREDAEECVNDSYHSAWNRMPPERPLSLYAFLGRITRNLAISRFRAGRAQKRYSGMEVLLSELDDCIPSPGDVERAMDRRILSGLISLWLDSLPDRDCALFVRRYWYGDAVHVLAEEYGCSPGQMAQRMLKLRRSLKEHLEKEGVSV